MPKDNQKTLMYIVDKDFRLLYANPDLLEELPDLVMLNPCHKELNCQDERCTSCPLLTGFQVNNTYYSKRLNRWFNTDSVRTTYEGKDASLILLKPIADNITTALNSMLKQHGFDVLIEADITNDRFRLLKSHPMLDNLPTTSLSETINGVAQSFIENFDYYRFKKFVEFDNIKDRFNRNNREPICNNFRLKSKIERAEWIHVEILPCEISDDLTNKLLITLSFMKTNNLRPDFDGEEIDSLTNLPSAQSYLNKIERIIRENDKVEYALASIDIDHFKIFNEWYGLTAGDVFLHDLGSEFKEFDRQYKTYSGYLGNDNFAILLPNDLDLIKELKNRLVKASKSHGDGTGFLPSIGIYLIDDKSCSISQMLDRATIAASTLKDGMANRLNYYSSSMMNTMEKEYKLLHDAINSIKNDEFVIYFQPKVNMKNNKIFAAEALVRWNKDGRIIPPNDFIPILEKTGSIVELDTYVWEKTMMWQRSLMDRKIRPIPVSVNVSRIDLYYLDVADIFINLSKKHRVPPSLIEIEITESTYAEKLENIQKIVDKLRAFGFKISLDDFGAGYSSLNALKNISVDILKLDIKFLDFESEKKKALSILEGVINMINSLNLSLICEGVETKEAVEVLMSLGCTYAQGFYYYKPMPLSSFEQFLAVGTNIEYEESDFKRIAPIKFKEFLNYLSYSDVLLDNILGPVCFISSEGDNLELMKLNESFSRLANISDINAKNNINNLREMICPEDKGKVSGLFSRAYANPIKGSTDNVRFNVNGEVRWIEIRIFFLDEAKEKKVYFVSAHDVTVEKNTEIVNKNKTEKLIQTLRLDKTDSFEYDVNNKILTIYNPTNEKLKKFYKGKNIITDFPESSQGRGIISKEDALKINLYATSAVSKLHSSNIRFDLPLNLDGELAWYRVSGEIVDDDKVTLIVGNYLDVTDEIVNKKSQIPSHLLKRLKDKSIYQAFANISNNVLYSINNKKYDTNDSVFDQAHEYDKLINLIVDYVADEAEGERLKSKICRAKLLKNYKNGKHLVEIKSNLLISGTTTTRKITVYMYEKDSMVYAYIFVEEHEDDIEEVKPLALEDPISYIGLGYLRLDLNTHQIEQINQIGLDIYGYSSVNEFNEDLRDDFSNRILDEDKPKLYLSRKRLVSYGDRNDVSFRVLINHEVKHIRCQEIYINIDGHDYIQDLFLDNTVDTEESKKLLDDEQKRLNELEKSANYNKSILIGINKLYVSSYTCDLNNNKYGALKYSKQMSELIAMSSTWEEFMMNYAKCYVHSENRHEFINMTTLAYIRRHLTYESDRISIRYKRLVDNGFKWYKMYLIASSFDALGKVETIIFAVRDVDNDTKTKEEYAERIEYYKDLFLNSSIDVYSGMLLIDMADFTTKDIVFNGKDVNERLYKDTWDKTFYRVLSRVEPAYRNQVIDVLSPESINSFSTGFSKSIKYCINLGLGIEEKKRFVSTTLRIMEYNKKKLATLFTIDITDDIKALEAAEAKSEYDILTGLFNRKRLDRYTRDSFPSVKSVGVAFFDINGLKKTNDSLGHKAGDALIKTAAKSLLSVCNDRVQGYRYGGDEFLLICENYDDEAMKELLKSWEGALYRCNLHANILCNMSYGYTISKDYMSLDSVILEADKEMYANKLDGKSKVEGSRDNSKLSALLKYIDTDYMFIYEIDLKEDRYRLIHVNESCPSKKLLTESTYTKSIEAIISNFVCPADKDRIKEVFSIEELKKCYIDKVVLDCRTLDCQDSVRVVIQAVEFEGGEARKVIIAEERNQTKFIS